VQTARPTWWECRMSWAGQLQGYRAHLVWPHCQQYDVVPPHFGTVSHVGKAYALGTQPVLLLEDHCVPLLTLRVVVWHAAWSTHRGDMLTMWWLAADVDKCSMKGISVLRPDRPVAIWAGGSAPRDGDSNSGQRKANTHRIPTRAGVTYKRVLKRRSHCDERVGPLATCHHTWEPRAEFWELSHKISCGGQVPQGANSAHDPSFLITAPTWIASPFSGTLHEKWTLCLLQAIPVNCCNYDWKLGINSREGDPPDRVARKMRTDFEMRTNPPTP